MNAVLGVMVGALLTATPIQAQTGALPSGWTSRDLGSPGATGSAGMSGSTYIVRGAGLDVWGTADHFRFVYRTLNGDGSIVAQVATVENVDVWTKAGVMMREALTNSSKHAFMMVTPGKGLAFQRRPSTGGLSVHTAGGSGTAPRWVRLTRSGNTFTAARSTDGVSWSTVGSQSITMGATIYVGLAVSSHETGDLATASFASVAVQTGIPAASAASAAAAPAAAGGASLRVLHWNTYHGGRRTDGVYDPANLVDWIVRMNPDVASLNELDNSTQASRIVSLIESRTGVNWTHHYDGRGNMVLTRLSVVERDECVVNGGVGRRSAFMTVTTGNGRRVSIYSSHLSLDAAERRREVVALQACARNKVEARILAGDFNMQTGSTEYQQAMQNHTDAWREARALGTAVNYSGNCDGCTRNSRIDYVFTSTGATTVVLRSAQIYDTRNASGVMASDHKPMLVVYGVR